MGCFIGCFSFSKNTKCKRQKYKIIRQDQKNAIQSLVKAEVSLVKSIKEKPCNLVSESREKIKVPLRLKRRKKVRFDTNVTTHTYERIQVYDSTEFLLENNEKGKAFLSQFNTNSKYDLVGLKQPNYRYVNCRESDDEVENFDHEDYDLDQNQDFDDDNLDDNDDRVLVSSMESRAEPSSLSTIGLKRNAHDTNGYVLSVLNPVENLSQWKALKSKRTTYKPLNFSPGEFISGFQTA